MTLGNHLGADQDIDLTSHHLLYQALMGTLAAGGVPIHTRHPRIGEILPDFLFETFGTHTFWKQPYTTAAIAAIRRLLMEITVMTAQGALYLGIGQRDITIRATQRGATIMAKQKRSIAPAVEKQQGLFSCLQSFFQSRLQRFTQQALALMLREVDQLHLG